VSLSRLCLAARIAARLCSLPLAVSALPLPSLLDRLTRVQKTTRQRGPNLRQTVQVVARVCRMRIFDLPVFPRPCLRRALALYTELGRRGYPVEIHFGIRKDGRDLHGHSWVTLEGAPLGERQPDAFRTVYSHSANRTVRVPSKFMELHAASLF
jgi:hypothetical protein